MSEFIDGLGVHAADQPPTTMTTRTVARVRPMGVGEAGEPANSRRC